MKALGLALAISLFGCGASPSAEPGAGDGGPRNPYVVSSSPTLDATDVYPAPVWDGNGESVPIALTFSSPMHQLDDLTLAGAGDPRAPEVVWSEDGLTLELSVRPSFSGNRPLADFSEYTLDLSPLEDDDGRQLEPNRGLVERTLRFTTGAYDPLLNHSCGHTFFGPYASVAAGEAPDATAPDISTTHTEYSVLLRASDDDRFSGWLQTRFPVPGPYRLYFDADVAVADGDGAPLPLEATPAACPGIGYALTIDPEVDEQSFYFLGPHASPTRRIIVELIPQ